MKLPGVHVTEGLGFIHFSVYDGQCRETITSDQFYSCLILPRDETGSHLYGVGNMKFQRNSLSLSVV